MKRGIKKVLAGILVISMILSVGAVGVFAAGPACERHFVDADGDGICDNYIAGQAGGRETNSHRNGHGRNFIDADGDGICDNYIAGQAGGREANSHRNGHGRNFIDADGDGICDNYGVRQGRGYRGRRSK